MAAGRMRFWEWLRVCAQELHVGGVDIIAEQLPARTKRGLLETKKRCADLRLVIVSLSPTNDFGKPTVAARRVQVDILKRWVEAGFILGAPYLRIFAGWPPAGQGAVLWSAMVRCIRQVAAIAAQAGITLVVEPHNDGGFLPDARRTLALLRELDSAWVKINLDTGNYHSADPYADLEVSLPYAPHVVAKVRGLSPEGEEVELDYQRIFALLKRHAYQGFVTLEYEGPEERKGVPLALAMLRRHAGAPAR
jgi:sugar phosphate isomerase/epimerase